MARLEERLIRLAALPPAGLKDEWMRVYKSPAPNLSPDLLRLGIAYRLQETALGKLPGRIARSLGSAAPAPSIRPGTQLVRRWHGRTLNVLVVEDGYLLDGKVHRSLSAIAREVTGVAWSGPRFFGIKPGG